MKVAVIQAIGHLAHFTYDIHWTDVKVFVNVAGISSKQKRQIVKGERPTPLQKMKLSMCKEGTSSLDPCIRTRDKTYHFDFIRWHKCETVQESKTNPKRE